MEQLAPDLFRWRVTHPGWDPVEDELDLSYQEVASLCFLGPEASVLIDPLLPHPGTPEAAGLLAELDPLLRRPGLPVHIVLTVFWHERSTEEAAERYGAQAWAPEDSLPRIEYTPTHPFRPGGPLPGGVVALPTARQGEVVLWLPGPRALVTADVLIGDNRGGIRLCPEDWVRISAGGLAPLRDSLLPLLGLEVELILPAHGNPVLQGARPALARALN
jgi:glyoxylase-like metal-dependent hydrolase (beta-lactamase superfamily II)